MRNFDTLSPKEKIAHWNETEAVLRQALATVSEQLEPKFVETIENFLSHNELGLAFEALEYGIEDSGLPSTHQLTEKLNIARARMGHAAAKNLEALK